MQTLKYSRFSKKGTSYEIGYELGELLEQSPDLQFNISNEEPDATVLARKTALLKEHCPNVLEEANGLIERLKIPAGRLILFNDRAISAGACSQMAFLPSITANGHLLVGRSYEFNPGDEKNFMNIKTDNFPAHIGFSLFLFGRFDGINEHGRAVTMSSCEFNQPSYGEGLWFPLILRILLDRCSKVDEALYLLKQLPVCCCSNILIADRDGKAAIAEIICYGDERKISVRTGEEFLMATNHYVNADMKKYDKNHGNHSEMRYKANEKMALREKGSSS
jgi:predicted choloylglycine hydrolase